MKKLMRLVVLMMCIAWLASLFGCGKEKPHMLDGPGMERVLWSAFTISRCTVQFETVYNYTVKYDDSSDKAELYVKACEGETLEKSIQLDGQTVSALFNLDLMSLPNAEPLDGTVFGLSVTDFDGRVHSKDLSNAMEQEILVLIMPYVNELMGE